MGGLCNRLWSNLQHTLRRLWNKSRGAGQDRTPFTVCLREFLSELYVKMPCCMSLMSFLTKYIIVQSNPQCVKVNEASKLQSS